MHRAASIDVMTDRSQDLDVVVLGGGGHVGLPLSLAFADAGLRVGIYDTNQAAGSQLANKYISATSTLKADTLEFPCFNSDTFYVRIYDWPSIAYGYPVQTKVIELTEFRAAEGIYLDGSTLVAVSDEYFHGTAADANRIQTYNFTGI